MTTVRLLVVGGATPASTTAETAETNGAVVGRGCETAVEYSRTKYSAVEKGEVEKDFFAG